MTSLPQGWHGIEARRSQSLTAKPPEPNSCLPTLRRRWNTSQQTNGATPRHNSSTALPNGFQSRITPPSTGHKSMSHLTPSRGPAMTRSNTSLEAENLKKELATIKAENSVLKARLRKLEDELSTKNRQIIKLRNNVQNEMIAQKKAKETEIIVSLRHQIQKIETTSKEKEKHIRKMFLDISMATPDNLIPLMKRYAMQMGMPTNGLGTNFMKHLKQATQPKQVRINSDASKSQVEKLRYVVHKLEAELLELQKNGKTKDRDIHLLKLQVSRQNTTLGIHPPPRISTSSARSGSSRGSVTQIPSAVGIFTNRASKSSFDTPMGFARAKSPVSKKSSVSTIQAVPKQRLSMMSKHSIRRNSFAELEKRVQCLRENSAARKIQKGWRRHKEMIGDDTSLYDERRAVSILAKELGNHQERESEISLCPNSNSDSEEEHLTNEQAREALLNMFKC